MKKLICLAVLILLLMAVRAQKTSIYIKAGLNRASFYTSGNSDEGTALSSYHAGFMAEVPIAKNFAVQPALLLSGKGAKLERNSFYISYKLTTKPVFIDLPVNVIYKIPVQQEKIIFFIGGGPYIAMGIAGKRVVSGLGEPGFVLDSEEKIVFSNDNPEKLPAEKGWYASMRRFDYGINTTAGLQVYTALVSVSYEYGLADLYSQPYGGQTHIRHRVLGISLGMNIGSRHHKNR